MTWTAEDHDLERTVEWWVIERKGVDVPSGPAENIPAATFDDREAAEEFCEEKFGDRWDRASEISEGDIIDATLSEVERYHERLEE